MAGKSMRVRVTHWPADPLRWAASFSEFPAASEAGVSDGAPSGAVLLLHETLGISISLHLFDGWCTGTAAVVLRSYSPVSPSSLSGRLPTW